MFQSRYLLIFLLPFYFIGTLLAQDMDLGCPTEIGTVDFPPLENYLRSKRSESVADKMPDFKLSGDVRVDFLLRRERQGPLYYRGGTARDRNGVPIPMDVIALKTNLRCDYKTDRNWMVAQLEFDNNAGIDGPDDLNCNDCIVCPNLLFGSGFCDYLCLKRAYVGYKLWECEGQKVLGEIGRRSLYYFFDSRIQYKARVDGVYLNYSNTYAKYEEGRKSNAFLKGAFFLIDRKSNHFGYAAETGVYNLCDTGFDLNASFINWKKLGLNQCGVRNPLGWKFTNVQGNIDYNFKDLVFGRPLIFYSAFIINLSATHQAFNVDVNIEPDGTIDFRRFFVTNPNKENVAWYIGFIWGDVQKQGDFSLDVNYQYVEPQAVPDCDIRGIGRGNANKETFSRTRRGNSNYKGMHTEFLYAITDKFQLDISWDFSRSVDKNVGVLFVTDEATGKTRIFKNHIFSRFEIELIHAF